MHTDEYEKSLLREVEVCRNRLERLKAALLRMERRYGMTTEAFVMASREGAAPVPEKDGAEWIESHEAKVVWEKRLREFEARVSLMKV